MSASAATELPSTAKRPRIVIIGAGLAGIAAGVALADAGVAATIIETRKRLGGRAGSFVDPATGQRLDNCQHVVMRSCTHLLDLYRRLGVADKITWHDRFFFIDGRGRLDTLRSGMLPAPLHLSSSLLRFKSLTLGEKIAISRGMWAVLRVGETGRAALADVPFAHWLSLHHQPPSVIEKFWAPVIISACNESLSHVPASAALQVFQEGFLRNRRVHEMGVAAVPLDRLYEPARAIIERAGGQVLTGVSAASFEFTKEPAPRITSLRLSDDQRLNADTFISTVPFDRLAKLITPDMIAADPRLIHLDQFTVSPILGIHLYFTTDIGAAKRKRAERGPLAYASRLRHTPDADAPSINLPHVALTQSPLQWVFNKGIQDGALHLHGVISAAADWVDKPADDIAAMAANEIRKALPALADAPLHHHRVIKEKRATLSLRPGIDALRPPTTGPIANLILAGDWTATGWPATMEGAVRSGYRAAQAVLAADNREYDAVPLTVPDTPVSIGYRLLASR